MHLTTRNVNTAFRDLVGLFHREHLRNSILSEEPSRNGRVLRIDEPVTVTYTHPRERVLFNSVRDANPFFHLYEALWMLAGRNDVAPLAYYNSRISSFSDDGKTFNGAYGYRWRHTWTGDEHDRSARLHHDQLDLLVAHLKADPTSRRAVLTMWNVEDDLLKIGGLCTCGADRTGPSAEAHDTGCPARLDPSKDVCCNTGIMFELRQVGIISAQGVGKPDEVQYALDMTVINRSNDLLWGLLGANYVHFSILQEYTAARLGVEVGRFHTFTKNLHVYADRPDWKPTELLAYYYGGDEVEYVSACNTVPLVKDPAVFEEELPRFVEMFNGPWIGRDVPEWSEPFLRVVADPMMRAFTAHKMRGAMTIMWAGRIEADDWRTAAREWLERRLDKRGKGNGGE